MRFPKNFVITILTLFLLGVAFSVSAQNDPRLTTDPGAVRDNDIGVDLVPSVPGPNQNVTITLSSYATNVNKAVITWSLDGKQKLSGIGKNVFSFTTGDIGSKTEIAVSMILAEGSRVDKQITIQPAQVDMLWETTDSYTPPFYKGKTLPIKESRLKVVALPVEKDGSIDPTTKVYNWKKNFVVDQSNSGYGKYAFIVKNSYLDSSDSVSLSVSSQTGSGSVGTLNINYVKPQILVYEDNPSYGLRLGKLLNNGFTISNGEINLSAEPFYFSKTKGTVTEKNMEYKWTINGTMVTPPTKPNELTIRGSTQSGLATISIVLTNMSTLFQEAKQIVNVTLGK